MNEAIVKKHERSHALLNDDESINYDDFDEQHVSELEITKEFLVSSDVQKDEEEELNTTDRSISPHSSITKDFDYNELVLLK